MVQKPIDKKSEKRVQSLKQNEADYLLSANNSTGMISKYDCSLFLENIKTAVVIQGPDIKIIQSSKFLQDLSGLPKDQIPGTEAIDPSWISPIASWQKNSGNNWPKHFKKHLRKLHY